MKYIKSFADAIPLVIQIGKKVEDQVFGSCRLVCTNKKEKENLQRETCKFTL